MPSLVQPCALRFAASSAQTFLTFDLLLNTTCSTTVLYSTSVASFVSARSFTLSAPAIGFAAGTSSESSERSVEIGFLILGMILFRKYQVHAGFITEWLTPVCRHIDQLRIFAVTLEHAAYRRLHVRGRAGLFSYRCRERIAGLDQRHVETHIEATGKHRVGLIRL